MKVQLAAEQLDPRMRELLQNQHLALKGISALPIGDLERSTRYAQDICNRAIEREEPWMVMHISMLATGRVFVSPRRLRTWRKDEEAHLTPAQLNFAVRPRPQMLFGPRSFIFAVAETIAHHVQAWKDSDDDSYLRTAEGNW